MDAVRYLNVHEAIGSLSLAVLPETIAAVQTVELPVEGIAGAADQSASRQIDAVEVRLKNFQALVPPNYGLSTSKLTMMQLGLEPDPDRLGRATAEHGHLTRELWRDLEEVLTARYLVEVSPVVAEDFRDALRDWRRGADASVPAFTRRFAAMAALLTRGAEVRRAVSAAPSRNIDIQSERSDTGSREQPQD